MKKKKRKEKEKEKLNRSENIKDLQRVTIKKKFKL